MTYYLGQWYFKYSVGRTQLMGSFGRGFISLDRSIFALQASGKKSSIAPLVSVRQEGRGQKDDESGSINM